jgi:stage III sporulation protein AB
VNSLVKAILSIIIILSASFIGYILSYKYVQRPRQIKHLFLSLQLLETEILYLLTPLPQALKKVGGKSSMELNRIFTEASELLEKKDGFCIEDAWRQSVEKHYHFTSLTEEDKEALIDFGMSLGTVDRDHQLKNFHFIYGQLKKQQQSAEELRSKNERMYRSLGVLLGVAIVILFL